MYHHHTPVIYLITSILTTILSNEMGRILKVLTNVLSVTIMITGNQVSYKLHS